MDEWAGWVNGFDAYRKGKGGDVNKYLTMHRAGAVLSDRKTGDRKTLYVPRAAVSLCGGIQPETLRRALGSEAFRIGLAARLLLAHPPARAKGWSEATVSEAL